MSVVTKNARTSQPVSLESLVNDAPRTFDDADFPVGTVAHQGDVMCVRIASLPEGKPRSNRQLADGTTQGARHILAVGDVFDCDTATVVRAIADVCRGVQVDARYIGPVFRTVDDKADVTHPEHGDHHYRGNMVIATVFQRVLDAEQREQRAAD